MREIQLIEVKSELGAGTRGASLGVDAIKVAALDFGSRFFKQYPTKEVQNENHLLFESSGSPYGKRISGILTVSERVADEVKKTYHEERFPVVLAGDHSTAMGTIAGIRKAFPKKRLGVVWIDAHADIHSPYTTPTGNVHGMPIAVSLDEDNLANKINKPDQETINYWFQLKNIGAIVPKIQARDLIYIGVRDVEAPEASLIKKKKIKNISVANFRKLGVERIVNDITSYLEQCDMIYVSFDVDSMDPTISRGTGTPVPNGFTEREAGALVTRLCGHPKICCFEMVEVNPTLDNENLMAENAFEILTRAINALIHD
ncbi:arginase [Albibacterium profundi]|uniref:Arginase n=1 Tax=Albibacterium profundi TaxID=3134906 RepID=A0ABV5CB95_9SPHI